jgi:cytoskeletal protein RodZ
VAVAGLDSEDSDDDGPDPSSEPPWHNRTPALIGASALGLVAIGLVILAATYAIREFSKPDQAPLNFVEPSFSSSQTASSTSPATTTATITTTSRPQTTDLSPGETPSSSTDTTSSDTASTETTSRGNSDDENDGTSTTRKRPRTNVTRTVQPFTP